MKISQILTRITLNHKFNFDDFEVNGLSLDSRLIKKGEVFFALQGSNQNGNLFIEDAIKNGASLIVCNLDNLEFPSIYCQDVYALLIEFLKILYPNLPENIYAITGTNGKSSVAEFIRQILEILGKKSASIGTLGVKTSENIEFVDSSLTTPDITSLYKNLSILKQNNINDVAIEVSSIGLEQGRVDGLKIDAASFTNFTQDHLDYHKNMQNYFAAKMILFTKILSKNGVAILNSDIEEFEKVKQICQNQEIIDYGFKAKALKIVKINQNLENQEVIFEYKQKNYQFITNITGEFQIYNILCALGNILAKYDLNEDKLNNLLQNFNQLTPAEGRMQKIATLKNGAQIFIDFAHSPDALENVLKMARKIAKSRLIILFGCGGDRDSSKRAKMGKIACNLADLVIISDDNPRTENASAIRAEILQACDSSKTIEIAGRKEAIKEAISMLEDLDLLILAGKGHEKYQIIGREKFDFDEKAIVSEVLNLN